MIKKVVMIVKYNIFGYLIGEGFGNVFKNKKSTGASLMIMCATMIIFGIFLMLSQNINHFVDDIKSEQGFQVFLKTDATDEEIIPLPSEDTTPPVTKIYFVSTRIGFYYFQTAKIAIIFQKTKNTPIHYIL